MSHARILFKVATIILSMFTILRVRMVMYPAGTVIEQMGSNNKDDRRYQQPAFILNKKLFQNQEGKAGEE